MSGTVYLSGPITGETYNNARYGWRKDFADMLEPGIKVLSPMRHEGHLAEIRGKMTENKLKPFATNLFSHGKMIVAKDFLDIDMSDIVLVHIKGAKIVSRGTLVEIGYAKAKGKTIITVMEDPPKGNPHDYPFVIENSNAVLPTLEDAAAVVNSLLSEGL